MASRALLGYTPQGFMRRFAADRPTSDHVHGELDALQSQIDLRQTSAQVTAAIAAGLAGYATTHSVGVAIATALAAYTTTADLINDYLNKTDAASTYRTAGQVADAIAESLPPLIWLAEDVTNASGLVSFSTPAGEFGETAPKFLFSCTAPNAAAPLHNVQQVGNVVQSGAPGSRVYTATAKVNRSSPVVILGIGAVTMEAAPAGIAVVCQARHSS